VFTAALPTAKTVNVRESLSAGGNATSHGITFDLVPVAEASRTIDVVDISGLVAARTLHPTRRYHAVKVTLEHALLLPGAIPLR